MPSLKRRIASVQVKLRKRQRDKEQKELNRLEMKRNKSLSDAKKNLAKAQAIEDAKDAALQKSQAKARLSAAKGNRGKKLLEQLKSGSKILLRDLRGKPERRSTRRKRTTKKIATTKKRR